jgi:hypothetical protein
MRLVNLNLSQEQIRKVRKSLPIKINPTHKCMNGAGVNLIVDEGTFNQMNRKFDTNRGLVFKLSQSEIDANKNLDKVADDEARSVIEGAGLFKHKKAKKTIKKIIDALEGDMEGKGLIKSIKKGAKKATKSAVKTVTKEVKDVAKDVKKEAEVELKKTISKVRNQAVKAVPEEMKETVDLVKKSVKAVKRFDAAKIDKIIKDIPKAYRDEIRDTYIGAALRESLVIGTDIAVQSAIGAMAMNPYTAPLVPVLQASWELGGETGTRMAIEKIGLGLGLGLKLSGEGLRASGKGLSASGKGLSASGRGLSASGRGVEMVKHKIDPFYLENKLTNKPTEKTKTVKQVTHEDKVIMGNGGGSVIMGDFLMKPVMSGILKSRPLKRVSIIQGQHQ